MKNDFKGKKIAVVGLSTEGLESVKYLVSQKAEVSACDKKTEKEFLPGTFDLLKKLEVELCLGPSYLDNLEKYSMIVRTPGMPLWESKFLEAKNKNIKIKSQTKIFFDYCPGKIIGVTGTKGKGTTATLIENILKKDKKDVYLGGNIGKPLINKINKMDKKSWIVLELSSFQLEDLEKSPHIAVVLNITVDHLASSSNDSPNYHKNREEYIAAKRKIVTYQGGNDFAVLNPDYESSLNFKDFTKAEIWYFSNKNPLKNGAFVKNQKILLNDGEKDIFICESNKVLLRGEHNLENITAAITASFLAGAKISSIKKAVLSFKGLEHRLELVKIINGVSYYNDSFATTPETTIAAIKSFQERIILIAGGSEKGHDYTKLGEEIENKNVKAVILIGKMADRIKRSILKSGNFKGEIIEGLSNMKDIVQKAAANAKKGEVVLLSPACASYDMFKNYKDRGEKFKNEVKNLR